MSLTFPAFFSLASAPSTVSFFAFFLRGTCFRLRLREGLISKHIKLWDQLSHKSKAIRECRAMLRFLSSEPVSLRLSTVHIPPSTSNSKAPSVWASGTLKARCLTTFCRGEELRHRAIRQSLPGRVKASMQ
jgi:hypothetical protein